MKIPPVAPHEVIAGYLEFHQVAPTSGRLAAVFTGEKPIDAEAAGLLAVLFARPAEFWLVLQHRHDACGIAAMLYTAHADGTPAMIRKALFELFKVVDASLKAGGAVCDWLLAEVDVNRLNEDLLVGLLVASRSGKAFLMNRPAFAAQVRTKLVDDVNRLVDELL